jgi:uncharacterized protein (DUF1330 family)
VIVLIKRSPVTAYFLFDNVEVIDPAGLARYAAAVAPTVAAHGGRYLAVAATPEAVEGDPTLNSAVLIEFPDLESARAWYGSPEYQPLKALRHRYARNTAVLFDGIDPTR